MPKSENYLIISDLQIPYEHERALAFCKYLKRHYKVADENVINVGDEVDQYWASQYNKSIEAKHTALQEIAISKDKIRKWSKAFPLMKIAISNHGQRWARKALACEIPSQYIRQYKDVLGFPEGWQLKKHWLIEASRKPFIVEHGDDYGGMRPYYLAALHNGVSTAIGHHHTKFAIDHIKTNGLDVWGMVTSALIDFDAYAFDYAQKGKQKPPIGCGVVLDGGLTPVLIRLDSF